MSFVPLGDRRYNRRPMVRTERAFPIVLVALLTAACAVGPMHDGRSAMRRGEFELAARHYRVAAEANSDEPTPWMELGRAEMAAERWERARDAFARVAALRPASATPRILIGNTWELQRQYDEALEAYRMACRVQPGAARPWRVLGTRLLRWGRAGDAIEALERALELAPDHAETWNALAMARWHTEDHEGAIRQFRDGIARFDDHVGLRLGLAASLINLEQYGDALAIYDALLAQRPALAPVHVGRAILLHELGRSAEALEAFESAARVSGGAPSYLARLEQYRAMLAARSEPVAAP